MQMRKYTYRLYPTKTREPALFEHLRLHQQLYNAALQERIEAYRKQGINLTYNDQQDSLTQIRYADKAYAAMPVMAERMTLRRLDKAFRAFFRRVKKGETPGFPRFKSLSRFASFEMCSHGAGWRFYPGDEWKHGKLYIKGVGNVRARGQARQGGVIKTCQVMHKHGRWWLSVTVECVPERQAVTTKACGLDWGVEHLATLAEEDGTVIEVANPRYHRNGKDTLAALQQSVSRKKRGSNRWRKACRALSGFRSKQARQRHDHHHKLSAKLASEYALVATEKLTIKNMTRSAKGTADKPGKNVRQKAGLNREILDTAPAFLLALIRYKVEETHGEFIETPTRTLKPSQRCPYCWTVQKKKQDQRQHECDCGCSMSRDGAAALTNLRWALGTEGQELT